MNSNARRPRILWADFLKIGAMYAVVLIHSAAPLLIAYNRQGPRVWWVGNLYDSLARWCIPVFFMLSGAFLIGKAQRVGPGPFLARRLQRIGIPFLIWSAVYFVWNIQMNNHDLSYGSFLVTIIREPAYYHLWYLYVLMGVYLFAPLLSVYLQSASKRNVTYFIILWVIFGSVLPTVEAYFDFPLFMISTAPYSLFRYLGFFLIGYLMRNSSCSRGWLTLYALVFLAGLLVTIAGTWWLTVVKGGGEFSGVFYEYYSPNVLIMSVSLFIIIKSLRLPSGVYVPNPVAGTISFVAGCVPGIYLVHALVIALLQQEFGGFRIDQYTYGAVLGVPLFALIVFGISLVFVGFIRLIPLLRRIVP